MDNLKCKECGNPLRILSGGHKSDLGSTDIVMVHIHGCMNPNCKIKQQEQHRTETTVESFNG